MALKYEFGPADMKGVAQRIRQWVGDDGAGVAREQ